MKLINLLTPAFTLKFAFSDIQLRYNQYFNLPIDFCPTR